MPEHKTWIKKDMGTKEWWDGMKEFLKFAFEGKPNGARVSCPCTLCRNVCYKTRKEVHLDLLRNGMLFPCWIILLTKSSEKC